MWQMIVDDLWGIVWTLVLIFGCLGLGWCFSKKSPEVARKIVHIGVSNWYFIYTGMFRHALPGLLGLVVFALFNAVMNVSGGLHALLGQKDKTRNWGLVWYPISFIVMILMREAGFGDDIALGCGMLGVGWGDGLAALIGRRFGRHPATNGKTWEGTATMFAVVTLIALLLSGNILMAIFCGLVGAVLELLTPFGLDNLTVPLGIYTAAALWSAYV